MTFNPNVNRPPIIRLTVEDRTVAADLLYLLQCNPRPWNAELREQLAAHTDRTDLFNAQLRATGRA